MPTDSGVAIVPIPAAAKGEAGAAGVVPGWRADSAGAYFPFCAPPLTAGSAAATSRDENGGAGPGSELAAASLDVTSVLASSSGVRATSFARGIASRAVRYRAGRRGARVPAPAPHAHASPPSVDLALLADVIWRSLRHVPANSQYSRRATMYFLKSMVYTLNAVLAVEFAANQNPPILRLTTQDTPGCV